MFKNSSLEKNKILGIRLNEASLKEFNKFCKDRQVSKSEIARKALTQYILLNYNEDVNPKLIFSKSQFKHIIECLNPKEIDELVSISIKNGTHDMKTLENIIKKTEWETSAKTEIDFQIKTLDRFIFSQEGQAWFEEFNYSWENDELTIKGEHKLGPNFSYYVESLLSTYFSIYHYELVLAEHTTRIQSQETRYLLLLRYNPKKEGGN